MSFLKNIWKANSKHKKLSEELAAIQNDAKEAENEQNQQIVNEDDVVTFKLKYLGSTVVEKISTENISTEAVKNVIKVAKAAKKKLQRVNLAVSLKGIAVTDLQGTDILKASIYRISNCSTDATHRQVFSFITTDENETMECHAFLCSKRKIAETVTLAVAHAFSTAYENWRVTPQIQEFGKNAIMNVSEINNKINTEQKSEVINKDLMSSNHDDEKLIDFDDEPILEDLTFEFSTPPCQPKSNQWVCFEDDFVNETHRNGFNLIVA